MGIECTRSLKRTVRSTEDTSSSEQLSNALVVAPATPVPSFPMYKTAWDEDERIRAQVSMLVRYAEGAIRDARTLMASFGIKLRSNYIACEAPRSSWLSAREAFRSAVVVGGECDGTIPQFSGPIDRVVGRVSKAREGEGEDDVDFVLHARNWPIFVCPRSAKRIWSSCDA